MPMKFCHRCGIVPHNHKHRLPRPDTPNRRATKGQGDRGRAWRRVRAEFLRDFPICQHEEGCIAEATHVHHIDGEGPTGERGLDRDNLRAMCPSHHGIIEAAQRRRGEDGQWISGAA
jgi:hypothetical protein